jgi:hypothetical protein
MEESAVLAGRLSEKVWGTGVFGWLVAISFRRHLKVLLWSQNDDGPGLRHSWETVHAATGQTAALGLLGIRRTELTQPAAGNPDGLPAHGYRISDTRLLPHRSVDSGEAEPEGRFLFWAPASFAFFGEVDAIRGPVYPWRVRLVILVSIGRASHNEWV